MTIPGYYDRIMRYGVSILGYRDYIPGYDDKIFGYNDDIPGYTTISLDMMMISRAGEAIS